MDLLNCKCKMFLCSEKSSLCENPSTCKKNIHIRCKCQANVKIPTQNLWFIYCQRKNNSDRSKKGMQRKDVLDTTSQNEGLKCKADKEITASEKEEKEKIKEDADTENNSLTLEEASYMVQEQVELSLDENLFEN